MGNVCQLPKRDAAWAQAEVRRIVELGEGRVIFTEHAIERMEIRGFFRADVINALAKGYVDNPPKPAKGGMICKVTRRIDNGRDCGVVTVIKDRDRLIIVTVEWEDLR